MKLMPALAAILLLALSISAHQASDHPFGNLSERAGHVVLAALLEAQQRGADSIDVNDLIVALTIEDQEPDAVGLFQETPPGGVPLVSAHEPFLPPKVAIDILVKMNGILPGLRAFPYCRNADLACIRPRTHHGKQITERISSERGPE